MSASKNQTLRPRWPKVAVASALCIALIGVFWLVSVSEEPFEFLDAEVLRETVGSLGIWGPSVIAGLITIAVVISPIPSAPIALAAGAIFGHVWGTVYVLVGAELGAIIAFGLARVLGYDLLRRWFGNRLDVGLLGSQNVLMLSVFLSRLMPFISFDIVSYAAGLTSLTFWRFAMATLAGIVPASFLLTHFGGEMASADTRRITLAVLVLGGITALPILIQVIRRRLRAGRSRNISGHQGSNRSDRDNDGESSEAGGG